MRIVHQQNAHHDRRQHACHNCRSVVEVDHKVDLVSWVNHSYIRYFDPDPGHGRDEDRVKYRVTEELAVVICPNCSATVPVGSRNKSERRIN